MTQVMFFSCQDYVLKSVMYMFFMHNFVSWLNYVCSSSMSFSHQSTCQSSKNAKSPYG